LIWKIFCEYLNNKLLDYKGIKITNFGIFTYEVTSDLNNGDNNNTTSNKFSNNIVSDSQLRESNIKSLVDIIVDNKQTHRLSPIFIIDFKKYNKILTNIFEKEGLVKTKCKESIYRKEFELISFNPVFIANQW